MQNASKLELELVKKEKASKDAYSFYFNKPLDFTFIPGQYIKLFLDIKNPDDRGSSRYFTISSSPTDEYIAITTRIIQSSFKIQLNSLIPGQIVRAFGPIGYFDYDPKVNMQSIFIAGGIGVTPFHSLLRYLNTQKQDPKITLFNSFSFKEESVFFEEFRKLELNKSNLKIVYSLTKEDVVGFEKGRIDSDMIKRHAPNYLDSDFFIVGPLAMVDSICELITKMGVRDEKIFKEDFTGY